VSQQNKIDMTKAAETNRTLSVSINTSYAAHASHDCQPCYDQNPTTITDATTIVADDHATTTITVGD
jgi:hypothetical protein